MQELEGRIAGEMGGKETRPTTREEIAASSTPATTASADRTAFITIAYRQLLLPDWEMMEEEAPTRAKEVPVQ